MVTIVEITENDNNLEHSSTNSSKTSSNPPSETLDSSQNEHSGFYGWWKKNHFFRSSTTPFQSKWDAGLSITASVLAVLSVPLIMLALPVLAVAALLTAVVIFFIALFAPTEHTNCRFKMSGNDAWNCVLWSVGLTGFALLTPLIEIALPLLIVPALIGHNTMRAYKTFSQQNELKKQAKIDIDLADPSSESEKVNKNHSTDSALSHN